MGRDPVQGPEKKIAGSPQNIITRKAMRGGAGETHPHFTATAGRMNRLAARP